MSMIVSCGNSDGSTGAGGGDGNRPGERATSRAGGGDVAADGCQASTPTDLVPVVERRFPHDPTSYVQGLLIEDGVLYESSGRYGESQLRAIDSKTGSVTSRVDLPADVFGEGLAVGEDGELVQLTWKKGVAYRWPIGQVRKGGKPSGEFAYQGEGWGLTTLDDGSLLMSDGSDRLTVRDPVDFSTVATHAVERLGGPSDQLNELEFDGTWVWANRYQSTEILRIDPRCWTVTGVVDAGALRDEVAQDAEAERIKVDVLNGIAHLPGTKRFLITGKWWPTMFEVSFVEKP
ncbi:MAG: glutaminyl-peptide cyclotransferase [Microthrixaceae bacterium]